ncbi:peptidoglycan-binding protein [Guyparkeria hydrothermalis]|uniref:peptidoglycan-binding protein n=1 Tax=Guyparkeria hydrothermalis TaxID=923 RepID=UPI002020DF1A|nr:peptidoglycan-binding protein [Guyparkeria hydrothermalis]MCL7744645.1 peptidoglycan-binding protein [Guyparkeria hydrothermalis]
MKKLALSLVLLFGAVGPASANYAEGMNYYEQQEYHQALQEFREAAARGDADAQYMLGRLSEAGNGTTQDFVEAHKWYNLAAARGHRHAADARDALAERMTDRQVAAAQQAARDWQPQETSSSRDTSQAQPDVETLTYRERVAEIQLELNRLGYDAGPTDGLMGDRTRSAIYEYQADMGVARDGQASAELLRHLRRTGTDEVAAGSGSHPDDSPQVVLQEDFSDGDYRRNPTWTVISGDFEVDRNGLRSTVETERATDRTARGLNSDRPEEIGLAVLGMILQQRTGTPQREEAAPAQPAKIFVDAPTDNAFRMELDLGSHEPAGHVELGLFQGSHPAGTGYRLVYSPGTEPTLRLIRLIFGNTETIAHHDGRLDLEDGRFHRIVWTRDESGQMQVRVDDRRLLRVKDNGLRDPFQGFVLENQGGDYSLGRIRIED